MRKIFSTFFFGVAVVLGAQTVFADEIPTALGLKVSSEATLAFKCADDAMDKISDESKKWYTVCEDLASKDAYGAFMWKRLNFQKTAFQKSLGDTFLSNRVKKFPDQDSGTINCLEDKAYVDQTGFKAVKVNCLFDIKNAKPLYITVLYLYPKSAAPMKIGAVIVVSSESEGKTGEKFLSLLAGFPVVPIQISSN